MGTMTMYGRVVDERRSTGGRRRFALFRFDHRYQGAKREHELLPNQQSLAFVLAHDFRFALAKRTEHAIAQSQRIGVVAAGFFEADRMVKAMGLDRRKNVRIPTGRVEAHIGVSEARHGDDEVERAENGIERQVKKRNYTEGNQKQFERVAHQTLHRIQLSDMVMRSVGPPQKRIVHKLVR